MQDIKTIIWDLDNTLYKFAPQQIDDWNVSSAHAASSKVKNLDFDTALIKAEKGYNDHRNSMHYLAVDHGLCMKALQTEVNNGLNEKSISACTETPSLFNQFTDYEHVILTLATRDWAHRMLRHIELMPFFEPHLIFGAEDYDFEDKANSARGILLALDKSNAVPEKTMFVEDTLVNLKPAKDNGVKTVYLHHDRPLDVADTAFVDLIVKDTPELLRHMASLGQAA